MQWLSMPLNHGGTWLRKSTRITVNKARLALLIAIVSAISFFLSCRMELNVRVYIRDWLSPPQEVVTEPLSSCFDKVPKSSNYYQGNGKFSSDFLPGLPVWESHTCYDFASLFKPKQSDTNELLHTYWSSNITNDFDEKQLATLRSFSATQNSNHSLIVWIPAMDEAKLTESSAWTYLKKQKQQQADRITYQVIDPDMLTKDTPIELFTNTWRQLVSDNNDREGRDDLLRMLVLYRYGGIWFDLNTLFLRDLSPLREHEWMAQGNCATGTLGNPFTGALFHFYKESPYVCEILEGAADLFKARVQAKAQQKSDQPAKRYLIKGPEIFGSKLYYRIYHRLLDHGIRPWHGLPWCFTDPSQCKRSNSLPSLFSNSNFDEKLVSQIFAYHWREKWSATPGKLFNFITDSNRKRLNW